MWILKMIRTIFGLTNFKGSDKVSHLLNDKTLEELKPQTLSKLETMEYFILNVRPGSKPTTSFLSLRQVNPDMNKRVPAFNDIDLEVEGRNFNLDGKIRLFVQYVESNAAGPQVTHEDFPAVPQYMCNNGYPM